jgi:hypothetical protein
MPATILAKVKEEAGAWVRAGAFRLQEVGIVRVCVEYVYKVGYSLGLRVVIGIGLEYESDSILGSLINRGACLL